MLLSLLAVLIFAFKALKKPGLIAGSFTLGYGLCRIIAEFFREPEISLPLGGFDLTMGMILSLPMLIGGALIIFYALRSSGKNSQASAAPKEREAQP